MCYKMHIVEFLRTKLLNDDGWDGSEQVKICYFNPPKNILSASFFSAMSQWVVILKQSYEDIHLIA